MLLKYKVNKVNFQLSCVWGPACFVVGGQVFYSNNFLTDSLTKLPLYGIVMWSVPWWRTVVLNSVSQHAHYVPSHIYKSSYCIPSDSRFNDFIDTFKSSSRISQSHHWLLYWYSVPHRLCGEQLDHVRELHYQHCTAMSQVTLDPSLNIKVSRNGESAPDTSWWSRPIMTGPFQFRALIH